MPLSTIRAEDEVFLAEGEVGVGAVRDVRPRTLLVFIEGYGDVEIGPEHIAAAHDGKVVLNREALDDRLREHLAHVHDREYRDPSGT
jgi:hypothetical protein